MSDWDILNLDEDYGWGHLQILDRLHHYGIDCYFVDMWVDDIVIISGYRPSRRGYGDDIADALNIPMDIIYSDPEHSFVIINLFELKAMRSGYYNKILEYE